MWYIMRGVSQSSMRLTHSTRTIYSRLWSHIWMERRCNFQCIVCVYQHISLYVCDHCSWHTIGILSTNRAKCKAWKKWRPNTSYSGGITISSVVVETNVGLTIGVVTPMVVKMHVQPTVPIDYSSTLGAFFLEGGTPWVDEFPDGLVILTNLSFLKRINTQHMKTFASEEHKQV